MWKADPELHSVRRNRRAIKGRGDPRLPLATVGQIRVYQPSAIFEKQATVLTHEGIDC